MQQIVVIVLVLLLVIFTFIPASYLSYNNLNWEHVKQILNLSAKVLANSVEESNTNFDELAKGTRRQELSLVEIDKEKLLSEFYDILNKNILDQDKVDYVKSHILSKVLVYYDRFYVTDANDNWSPPYFFTDSSTGTLVYLNTKNDEVYYYDNNEKKVRTTLDGVGISEKQKNEIIIGKVNQVISRSTSERGLRKGLNIEIYNPYNDNPEYRAKHSYFNIMDGITFFVVYAEDNSISINVKDFKFTNYNVVGYTLE